MAVDIRRPELRKPRFKLPSALGLLGAAGVGWIVGRASQ